jgi:hypothetical protein
MYADQLLPEPKILPPNEVSVYIPTSFTEYSFYRGGAPRKILAAPTAGNHGDRLRTNKQLLKAVFENLRIAIKTIMKKLEEDGGLQSDDRRVGIVVDHH